jgi:pyrimidine-nucleoside phosphorylase
MKEAKQKVKAVIDDSSAFEVFKTLVRAQGGDVSYVDDVTKFPVASIIETVNAPQSGYLKQIHAREVGETAVELGAGRAIKSDPIDHSVGIMMHTKVGDYVTPDSPLFTIYANDAEKCAKAKERLLQAYQYSDTEIERLPLFYDVIGM